MKYTLTDIVNVVKFLAVIVVIFLLANQGFGFTKDWLEIQRTRSWHTAIDECGRLATTTTVTGDPKVGTTTTVVPVQDAYKQCLKEKGIVAK